MSKTIAKQVNNKVTTPIKSFDILFDRTFTGVRDGCLSRVMRRGLLHKQLPIIAPKKEIDNNKTSEVMWYHENAVIGKLLVSSIIATVDDGIRITGTLTPFGDGAVQFIDAVKSDTLLESIIGLYGLWGNEDGKFVTVLGLESNLAK